MASSNIQRDIVQNFVVKQLVQKGFSAEITHRRNSVDDIISTNPQNSNTFQIKVKTFKLGSRSCVVGLKAELYYGENFFWVLGGVNISDLKKEPLIYVIPSNIMSEKIKGGHKDWLNRPGRNGQLHKDSGVRIAPIPPYKSRDGWDISEYEDRWDLIEKNMIT